MICELYRNKAVKIHEVKTDKTESRSRKLTNYS